MNNTITTETINKILTKYNKGKGLTRKEKFFYQNIEGTISGNYDFVFTNEELNEYTKCSNDILYFIEKYLKRRDTKTGDIKPIKLFTYQKDILKEYNENRFLILCTSRQVGISTLMCIIHLHIMIFNSDKKILNINNKLCNGVEKIDRIKELYLNLPYFLKPGVLSWNKKQIKFNNNSEIKTASDILQTFDICHIDNFAHIPPNIINPIYYKLISSVSSNPNSRITISSSPNGTNLFYDLYEKSQRKTGDPEKNIFKSISVYWWEVPGRDQRWKEEKIKMLGSKERFEQEYNNQFIIYNK